MSFATDGLAPEKRNRKQSIFIALAAILLAGVLYIGDTTMQHFVPVFPDLPLVLPVLVITVAFLIAGTPEKNRRWWIARIRAATAAKQWPLAGWALAIFLLWLVWMVLSALWAPPNADIGVVSGALLSLGLIAIVTAALFFLHPNALAWFWLAIAVFSLIFLVGGFIGPGYSGRMTAFGGGPNVFARFMLYGIAATIFFALWRKHLWISLVLVIPFGYGLVASGSRGVMVASIVIVAFAMLAILLRWGWKRALKLYAIAAAVLAIGYFLFIAGTTIDTYFKSRFIELTFTKKHDSGRSVLHDEAFRIMSEHRLFGAGLHSFQVLLDRPNPLEHPHNIFYTVGAEGGLVGIVLLVLCLGFLALACRDCFRDLPISLTFAVGVAILVAQLFSGYYYDSRPIWIFGFAAVFAVLGSRAAKANEEFDTALEPRPLVYRAARRREESSKPKTELSEAQVAFAAVAAIVGVGAAVKCYKSRRQAKLDEDTKRLLRTILDR